MKYGAKISILIGLAVMALPDCRRDKKSATPEPVASTAQPPSDWDGSSDWSASSFEVIQE
ncbi:MAG: hypothetical protein FJ146_01625 [Deltaproteobacteria bacterium]|nr:hypothetical protein [Deltaproteobacteria bacterium]